jgi:hypothetical protein
MTRCNPVMCVAKGQSDSVFYPLVLDKLFSRSFYFPCGVAPLTPHLARVDALSVIVFGRMVEWSIERAASS